MTTTKTCKICKHLIEVDDEVVWIPGDVWVHIACVKHEDLIKPSQT